MSLEDLHHRADDVEDEDDLDFLRGFEPQADEGDLHRDGKEEHEIVAAQGEVRRPEEFRDHQRGQHEAAEQAGPSLFEAEMEEFGEDKFQPRAGGDEARRGEDVDEPGEEGVGIGCRVGAQI